MSGFRAFVRQLGYQPGIQLNQILDATDGAAPDNIDQIPAVVARLTRGRIDRPIRVTLGNFYTKTGGPASVRQNVLNEAKLQCYEALQSGADEVVIQRLVPAAAAKSYAVLSMGSGANLTATVAAGAVTGVTVVSGGTNYVTGDTVAFTGAGTGATGTITANTSGVITSVTVSAGGSGYTSAPTVAVNPVTPAWSVASSAPSSGFLAYFLHNDCFNDGIKLSIHADANIVSGSPAAATVITLRLYDSADVLLGEWQGSFDPTAIDGYGVSQYLPDVVSKQTQSLDVSVATGASIATTNACYGRDSANKDKWATSGVLVCFTESGTTYANSDYDRCIAALRTTVATPFGYLFTGGSQAVALVSKLIALGVEINTQIEVDVPGNLSASAAQDWVASLNVDTHYASFYYAPLQADDPMNGGKVVWGTGGIQVGMRCARNAKVNAKGYAPKQYPIAGKEYPLSRTGVRQLVTFEDNDLSDLAKARINPVIYQNYSSGGEFVFTDCLTAANTVVSYKKLIPVAEMSSSIDNWISLYSKEILMLPMSEYLARMDKFLDKLFQGAQASGWLVASKNLPKNAAYAYTVQASEVRPADLANVTYFTSYDGVARQVVLQQTLVK